MLIKNSTRKTILAEEYRICRTLFSKARGLMFKKQENLMFVFDKEKIIPLHMLFVFYPIDVIYLDADQKVVELKEDLKPFTFYTPLNKAQYVLELEKSTIRKTKTKEKDLILWN